MPTNSNAFGGLEGYINVSEALGGRSWGLGQVLYNGTREHMSNRKASAITFSIMSLAKPSISVNQSRSRIDVLGLPSQMFL